jgi:hypothetical protein
VSLLHAPADVAHGAEVVQWVGAEHQKAGLVASIEPADPAVREDGLRRRGRPELQQRLGVEEVVRMEVVRLAAR